MLDLDIFRISMDENFGTFGVLKWRDKPAPFALSLEDPWRMNAVNVSCIPAGTYTAKKFDSPTHGMTFQIMDVQDRTYILFHRGNTHINTKGCVLIGEEYSFLGGIPSVASSKRGWGEFWGRAQTEDEFQVHIRWPEWVDNVVGDFVG